MNVFAQLEEQSELLHAVISTLPEKAYQQKIPALYQASIGDHTRHIVEILQCAVNGYAAGMINYHTRERNLKLAEDPLVALHTLQNLVHGCKLDNKTVNIIYGKEDQLEHQLQSTYHRELLYNVEHTIHHMALIKVALLHFGIRDMPVGFGIAYSTQSYQTK